MTGIKGIAWLCMGVAFLGLAAPTAHVEQPTTNRIVIEYGPAEEAEHVALRHVLQGHRILEQFRDYLAILKLPQDLKLLFASCEGEEEAWYDSTTHAATVCYEYVAYLRRLAPTETTADGVTPEDTIIGPMMEVVLHEVGHAIFDLLKLPVLGREEDAADQFAHWLMLQMGKDTSRRTVVGTAHMYWKQTADGETSSLAHKPHSPPEQRFYNLVCIAYGWDTELFADLASNHLTEERAGECQDEIETLKLAFQQLVSPHIDMSLRIDLDAAAWVPMARAILADRATRIGAEAEAKQ